MVGVLGGSCPPEFEGDTKMHELVRAHGGKADYCTVPLHHEAVDLWGLDLLQPTSSHRLAREGKLVLREDLREPDDGARFLHRDNRADVCGHHRP